MARDLVRAAGRAALSTMLADGSGPLGSLVLTACSHEGAPLLLLSDLAEHARNLKGDPRAGLLYAAEPGGDALSEARVSVLGRVVPVAASDDRAGPDRARFLARNPSAASYAGFGDFRLYRMAVERAHFVAGFGRIGWLERDALILPPSPRLAESEAAIVGHMNADHADAVSSYATRLLGRAPGPWRLTGVDPEGIDIAADGNAARLGFPNPVDGPEAARAALVELAARARGDGGDGGRT